MMSVPRTMSQGDADSSLPAKSRAAEGWMDRYLPARGFERIAFLVLGAMVLGLKILAIYHFRSDSDETQHAHVVWGWVTGKLQYRDVFDNHMPLFQMLCAPLMALLGERADIMIPLRWAMLPLTILSLLGVYRVTEVLYSRRLAPWIALLAAILAKFFYTSTEFRTDQLWTAFWMLSLAVMVSGNFTVKRAFGFGLMLGLAGAVSVKTVPLVVSLATAAVPAFAMAWRRGERLRFAGTSARMAAMGAGMVIPPAATILYFVVKGAFWIMYYCVIAHNMVPGLKRWGHFEVDRWVFPISFPFLAAYAWLIFRQTPDTRLAIRRTIINLTPWCYLFLLLSYWPDVTREDDLPYIPLVPLSVIPLVQLAAPLVRSERWRRGLLTYGLPALVLIEFMITFKTHNIREDRLRVTTHNIGDVLKLTKPGEYVMENKGDYVFRPRAYYWVLEPITKARVRLGTIKDSIPQRLIEKDTQICYFRCGREGSHASQFIVANYLPFDPETRDMGVLGKIIGKDAQDGTYAFTITIPQTYAVVTETGEVAGELDGRPYTGPVWLAAGKHEFQRTGGGGRVAVFWNGAYSRGFRPLFNADDKIVKEEGTLQAGKKSAEMQ
jgi:hypothetical protein